jgi:hypothetical protein
MFLKPTINLYYSKRTFLQPQFWVSLFQECILSLKSFWCKNRTLTSITLCIIHKPNKNDRNMPCNKHTKNGPHKKSPFMWLHVTEFWTFPRQHFLVTAKLKQNNHNYFYTSFTQFRIMKNVLLFVHTWNTVLWGPTNVKNFVNLSWHNHSIIAQEKSRFLKVL